jgi:hypothetical protein
MLVVLTKTMEGEVTNKNPRQNIIYSAIFLGSVIFSTQMWGSGTTMTRISVAMLRAPATINAAFRLPHTPPEILVSQLNANGVQIKNASRIVLAAQPHITPIKIQMWMRTHRSIPKMRI